MNSLAEHPVKADRLCYVLPKYDSLDTEHFVHIPNLLSHVARYLSLSVLIEKGASPSELDAADEVIVLRHGSSWRPIRAIEFLIEATERIRRGYRKFFIRYSRTACTLLLLLRILTRLRVYYWASGQQDYGKNRRGLAKIGAFFSDLHFKWIVRSVDYFVTGPESMTQYMIRRWDITPSRTRLLYNDIDTSRFRPCGPHERNRLRKTLGWREREFVVLFVHRLSERRGSRLLIPIAENLLDTVGPVFRLVVVGAGPDSDLLGARRLSSRAGDLIQIVGPLPNRDLPELYRASDCFLMPSFDEGFPRVVLEAMASGVPVVATRAGGTVDILGGAYPLAFPTGDVQRMTDGLALLFNDRVLADRFGRELRGRAVELFDTPVVAKMLVDLIRET